MEEKVNLNEEVLPETERETLQENGAVTIPAEKGEADTFLEIKFNKELIKLDREKAVTLAQKGMKYDSISEDYERLKSLTNKKSADDIERIKTEFPEISSPDMLPEEVQTAATENNTGLFLEYLLYEHRKLKAALEEKINQSFTSSATTGSLSSDDREDPTAAEFLRGVWGK